MKRKKKTKVWWRASRLRNKVIVSMKPIIQITFEKPLLQLWTQVQSSEVVLTMLQQPKQYKVTNHEETERSKFND